MINPTDPIIINKQLELAYKIHCEIVDFGNLYEPEFSYGIAATVLLLTMDNSHYKTTEEVLSRFDQMITRCRDALIAMRSNLHD